ncbi:uncharacterized protein LOC116417976 [Nasonia vitripennis]|uniref:Uncharacterized protein n=1 Tax=Nasonia vitripennis TaxID=7425 RepID=A0A7M7QM35_NASVI|nr:uncharacterized protein LOC116417976 [Nasonia vitripennis]
MQHRIRWLIANAPTLLMMLEHVSWAMEAINTLPSLPPLAAMQQLYEGIRPGSSSPNPARRTRPSSSPSTAPPREAKLVVQHCPAERGQALSPVLPAERGLQLDLAHQRLLGQSSGG